MTEWEVIEARFWPKVDVAGPVARLRPDLGRCWLWTGSVGSEGYGQFWREQTPVSAHRAAWEIAAGQLAPKGLRFDHFACGVRLCVNPAHVRPIVSDPAGRWLIAWNETHERCVAGHELTPRTVAEVPGGLSCRLCRSEAERRRESRHGRRRALRARGRTPGERRP